MTSGELPVLARAHALFAGQPGDHVAPRPGGRAPGELIGTAAGVQVQAFRQVAAAARDAAARAASIDAELMGILAQATRDHRDARAATAAVLAAARTDSGSMDNPVAARELLRRRVIRLRTQREHVVTARRRARRRQAALLALRYGHRRRGRSGATPRAEAAVRAALTRLGCPYVWGATGPDRFDCSGLVKWAYAQAGVPLHRTTYEQIHDGVPVARSQVRPGDLVFPHAGHVQLAIGNNLVVEAPHAGATVRISPLGSDVAIRRPV